MARLSQILGWGLALFFLVGCGRSVTVEERFTLREGKAVRLKGTALTIRVEQIIDGLDGSQRIGDGSATLLVTVKGEGETEVSLETGNEAVVGGYAIYFERVVSDAAGLSCELVITRR